MLGLTEGGHGVPKTQRRESWSFPSLLGYPDQAIPVWIPAGALQGRTLSIGGLQGYVGQSLPLGALSR